MLPENKEIFDYLGITDWHKAGYTGQRMKIGILDSDYDSTRSELNNVTNLWRDGKDGDHAIRVMSVIQQIVPDAEIYFRYGVAASSVRILNEHNVDIINISLGMFAFMDDFKSELINAYENNIPIITSAGNDSSVVTTRASISDYVLNVAALTFDERNVSSGKFMTKGYSSVGGKVDVASFTDIQAETYNGEIGRIGGTSGAAPMVTGMTALMMSGMARKVPPHVIYNTIYKYCDDQYVQGRDVHTGMGLFRLPVPGSVR